MKTTIKQVSRRVWEWEITGADGSHLSGGYCATKRDAINDAGIMLVIHLSNGIR